MYLRDGRKRFTMNKNELILLVAGLFIGALLKKDPRHKEARSIVEKARQGKFLASTTTSILSEVYAALTWVNAKPPHSPTEAANAVRLLVDPPSKLKSYRMALKHVKKCWNYPKNTS